MNGPTFFIILSPKSISQPRPDLASFIVRLVLGLLLAAYFIAGFSYLGLRYYLWPRLNDWRPELVEQLSEALEKKVSVGLIETGFEGFWPRLTIHDLRIEDDDGKSLLSVPRAIAVVAPLSVLTRHLSLSVLQLDSPSVLLERLDEQRWRIGGVTVDPQAQQDGQELALLLAQRRLLLHDARIDWIDHRTGRRASLSAIEFALGSVGRRHRGSLQFSAADIGVSGLGLTFDMYRAAGVPASNWRAWSGQVHTGLEQLDLARLAAQLSLDGLRDPGGQLQLKAWLALDSGRMRDGLVRLSANQLRLPLARGPLNLQSVQLEAGLRPDADGYLANVERAELVVDDQLRLSASGVQQLNVDGNWRIVGGRVSMAPFEAGTALARVLRMPIADDLKKQLEPVRLSGDITALSASWSDYADSAFEAAVDFRQLSLRYDAEQVHGRLPWFENLSGEARVRRDSGELRIKSRDGALGFPGVFAEPRIVLDEIRSEASWKFDGGSQSPQLAVEIGHLQFANADAAGSVSGSYRTGGKGAGIVDLTGQLSRARVTRVARYLPIQIDSVVRQWVADSILTGQADRAEFALRGDLEDFPYRDPQTGEFLITAEVRDTRLRYASDWPAIDAIRGQLRFERAGMRIQAESARVFDVALGKVQARLDDFDRPRLQIAGSGNGPASDMLRFVNESPIATRIDDFTRSTSAAGQAGLSLQLQIPLDDLSRSKLKGAVQFSGNTLKLDEHLPELADTTGTLEFTDEQLSLRDLSASFLGELISINGTTPEPGQFALQVKGRVSAQAMRKLVDNPLMRALDGATDFLARIDVNRRASTVVIESDLIGLASRLPAPMNKAAQASWPLRLTATPERPADPLARPARDEILVELGEAIRLRLARERSQGQEKLRILRGALALNAAPVLPEQGLAVILQTSLVDIDAWRPLLSDGGDSAKAVPAVTDEPGDDFSLNPQSVTLVTSRVRIGGKDLHDVVLGATRTGRTWSANVDSREVNGYFTWRAASPGQPIGKLSARFGRLEIPRSQVSEIESLLDAQATELPALDVVAERFVLFDHSLGRLELQATNGTSPSLPGWRLDRLHIQNPQADFLATGSWTPSAQAGVRPTRMKFDLDLVDSGATLDRFGLNKVMRGGPGKLSGEIHWLGSPMSIDYPSLGGKLVLDIGKGQFLKTDPGLAKLIGVLNLQSLPRRLSLDFRDVFAEGYAFDSIKGDIAINHGVARTSNLAMRGVQAQVQISGDADIEHETQSLAVAVVPELNAGLASIAYGAMVNPAIGLGSFLAQLALRGPIQQIFTYEYDVKGSWADPQVIEKRRPTLQSPPPTMP